MDKVYSLLPQRVQNISTYMDFDGQRRAERIFQMIIALFAVVGFIWGYLWQQFSQTVYILMAGFILSCILTLPAWPMYRKKPLKWQPAQIFADTDAEPSTDQASTTQQAKGKKKK
jgi:signal peptidase complex subunit 1